MMNLNPEDREKVLEVVYKRPDGEIKVIGGLPGKVRWHNGQWVMAWVDVVTGKTEDLVLTNVLYWRPLPRDWYKEAEG